MNAIRFRIEFEKIRDYSEKFYQSNEHGLNDVLGCRYANIDFDSTHNVDSEINYLKGLLRIYNHSFVYEIDLIEHLIKDLEAFKPHLDEYLNS